MTGKIMVVDDELLDSLRSTSSTAQDAAQLDAAALDDLEKEHTRRVFRRLVNELIR